MPEDGLPAVVLGAGYAGVRVAHEVRRRSHGRLPVVLVDRMPVHVLRTQLYEVGRMALAAGRTRRWVIPLDEVIDRPGVSWRSGEVASIDLEGRTVGLPDGPLEFGSLAICLGNVPAYYGVAGAESAGHEVYSLGGAFRTAAALTELERNSATWPIQRRPRVMVVGGGSTGTEVAAEVATVDWTKAAGPNARAPEVILVCGALPFLNGLPESLVRHARELLYDAGVVLHEGVNVRRVEPEQVSLEDGSTLPYDLLIWAAGLRAPPVVDGLPAPHGHGGRLKVTPELELPGHPGVFALGDVMELEGRDGSLVPATAQAALEEAPVAGRNMVARWEGRPLRAFRYREKGTIVSVGLARAAGTVGRRLALWGSPASLLKSLVQREYAAAAAHGRPVTSRFSGRPRR